MDMPSIMIGLVAGAGLGGMAAWAFARGQAAAARAAAELHQQAAGELRSEVKAERARAEEVGAALMHEREENRARQVALDERTKALADIQRQFEESKAALSDAFKATGADVLKETAKSMLDQAKRQFEGQKELSQQELEARKAAIDALVKPLREQLDKHEKMVKEFAEKREGDARALGEQLKQIADLQQQASNAAKTLSGAMRDTRQRGRWGEVSLRNVVEMAGLGEHVDFVEQSSIDGDDGSRLRPDMIVNLPGNRFIPIDAKVPVTAYFDSIDEAAPEADRKRRRADHAAAVRTHMRALMSRDYARSNSREHGATIEITVMFVPVESAWVAALEADPGLFSEAMEARVIITGPATLLALLRVCAMQWSQAQVNDNARKIGDLTKQLVERAETFTEHLQKIGKGLESASRAFNDAVGSFNARLIPALRSAGQAAGKQGVLEDDVTGVTTAVRSDIGLLPDS